MIVRVAKGGGIISECEGRGLVAPPGYVMSRAAGTEGRSETVLKLVAGSGEAPPGREAL